MKKTIVVKLGGSVLTGARDARSILDILGSYEGPLVVVVSALKGVTDRLIAARDSRGPATGLVGELETLHAGFLAALDPPAGALALAERALAGLYGELRVLLEGAGGADRMARIASFGERLSAPCVAAALAAVGREAAVLEPARIGLIAVGPWEDAEADLAASAPLVARSLGGRPAAVVPGFYGVGTDGLVRLFGRGGSDYSAAAIAACLGARSCDLVKDSSGLLTADPVLVPEARRVRALSYREAAELARGGAKILHPRAVAPLAKAGVPLRILGSDGPEAATVVGPRRAAGSGPSAIALGKGPRGTARLTVAGEGAAARSAAAVLYAFEEQGLRARSFSAGPGAASFRVLVDASRGAEALRAAHDALFGRPLPPRSPRQPILEAKGGA
jgi:aspartate kinase/aspartokinase/homoserine dehydrogenase 1